MHFSYFLCPAAADPRPALRDDETDDDHEPDRAIMMDIDEERDFADQGPLTDMDQEAGCGGGAPRSRSRALRARVACW
jgi:hypothetical protein